MTTQQLRHMPMYIQSNGARCMHMLIKPFRCRVWPGATLCAWLRSVSSAWKEAADMSDARTGRDCSLPTLPCENFAVPRARPLPNACPLGTRLSRALLAALQSMIHRNGHVL